MVSVVPALCLALLLPAVWCRSSKLPGGCSYTTNIVTCDGAHNLDYKYLAATVMMDYVVVFVYLKSIFHLCTCDVVHFVKLLQNVDIVVVTSSPCSIAKLVDCGVALPLDEPIIVAGLIVSRKSPQLRWAVKHQIMNLCDKIEDLFDSELRIQFYNAVMQDLKAEESELEKIGVSKGEPIYLHKVEPFPPTLPTFVTTVQPVEPKRLTTGENDAVAQFFESSVVKDVAKAIEQIPTNVGPINNEGKIGDNPSEEELQIVLKEEMKDIKKDMKGRRKRHVDRNRRKWRSRRPRPLADNGFRGFSNNREQSIGLSETRSKRQVGKKRRKWQSRRPRSLSPAQESINGWSNYQEKMSDSSKLNKKDYTENKKRRWRSRQRKQLTLAEEIFEILFSNSSDRGEFTERMKGQLGNKRRKWRSRRQSPLTPSEEMLDELLSNATIHERNSYLPQSYEDVIQGRTLTRYKRVASLPIFIPQKVFINGEYLSMFDTNGIAEDKRLEATLVTPGTIPPIRTTPPPTTTPSVGDHRNPAAAMLFKNAEEARVHAVSNGLLNLDDEDDDDDDVENESPVLTDPIDQVSEQALLKQIQVNKGPMKAPNNTAVVVDRWSEMRRAQAEATAADHRVKSFVIFFVAVIGVISVVAVLLILAMKDKRSWGKFAIFELPKKRSERERREHQEKLLRQHEQMIQRKRNIYNHYDGVDSDEPGSYATPILGPGYKGPGKRKPTSMADEDSQTDDEQLYPPLKPKLTNEQLMSIMRPPPLTEYRSFGGRHLITEFARAPPRDIEENKEEPAKAKGSRQSISNMSGLSDDSDLDAEDSRKKKGVKFTWADNEVDTANSNNVRTAHDRGRWSLDRSASNRGGTQLVSFLDSITKSEDGIMRFDHRDQFDIKRAARQQPTAPDPPEKKSQRSRRNGRPREEKSDFSLRSYIYPATKKPKRYHRRDVSNNSGRGSYRSLEEVDRRSRGREFGVKKRPGDPALRALMP